MVSRGVEAIRHGALALSKHRQIVQVSIAVKRSSFLSVVYFILAVLTLPSHGAHGQGYTPSARIFKIEKDIRNSLKIGDDLVEIFKKLGQFPIGHAKLPEKNKIVFYISDEIYPLITSSVYIEIFLDQGSKLEKLETFFFNTGP